MILNVDGTVNKPIKIVLCLFTSLGLWNFKPDWYNFNTNIGISFISKVDRMTELFIVQDCHCHINDTSTMSAEKPQKIEKLTFHQSFQYHMCDFV